MEEAALAELLNFLFRRPPPFPPPPPSRERCSPRPAPGGVERDVWLERRGEEDAASEDDRESLDGRGKLCRPPPPPPVFEGELTEEEEEDCFFLLVERVNLPIISFFSCLINQ